MFTWVQEMIFYPVNFDEVTDRQKATLKSPLYNTQVGSKDLPFIIKQICKCVI